jgi:hypothetical protein
MVSDHGHRSDRSLNYPVSHPFLDRVGSHDLPRDRWAGAQLLKLYVLLCKRGSRIFPNDNPWPLCNFCGPKLDYSGAKYHFICVRPCAKRDNSMGRNLRLQLPVHR